MGGEEKRASRIELACFALVALLPLVPYLAFLLAEGAPRYTLHADFALIEHEVRHVFLGDTLLGLGSRFHWHHPGPAFFYLCAPFTALFGSSSTGLYVGTWVLAAFSAAAPVVTVRLYASRAYVAKDVLEPVRARVRELAREHGIADRRVRPLRPVTAEVFDGEQLALAGFSSG